MLTKTGYQLCDIGSGLSWPALFSFILMLPEDSRLRREIEPEYESWSTRTKTNAILADIYDMLARINANLVAAASRKAAKQTKPYPRPWLKKEEEKNKRHFGRDPLPPDELRKWFEEKRKSHASSSKRDS